MTTTSDLMGLARAIVLVALGSLAWTAMAAKPNLNPEYGDSAYREFSVFSPDAATPDDYKPDVMVVFHGFMSAVPNGTFKRVRKKLLKTHTTLGLNYNPLDVAGMLRFLRDVQNDHLQGRRVAVLGTSLGGFWARYFGHMLGADKVIMLNPVVRPSEQLARYNGATRSNQRRQRAYAVTAVALAPYAKIDVKAMHGPQSLLIVTRDDNLQSPDIAIRAYKNSPFMMVQVYETGGHTINLKKHAALERIAQFVTGE